MLNVKEKLQIVRKDGIKCRELIKNFKNSLNLWFIYGTADDIVKEVLLSCVEIILHGLKIEDELQTKTDINSLDNDSSQATFTASSQLNNNKKDESDLNLNKLHKIIDDFRWVCNAVTVKRSINVNNTPPQDVSSKLGATLSVRNSYLPKEPHRQGQKISIDVHVAEWLKHNINESNLCGFLQYLVNDKELLEEHYTEEALIRQEKYTTILIIGLTAFETKQYCLLSHIDEVLRENKKETKQHKRSKSQPNIFLVHSINSNLSILKQRISTTPFSQSYSGLGGTTIRKTQSLHEFINNELNKYDTTDGSDLKSPSRNTIYTMKRRTTCPQNIPQTFNSKLNPSDSHITNSSAGSFMYDYDDNQPTTSQASSSRSKSQLSNYTLNSNKSATSSLMSTSASSSNSNNTTKCIQLINTDGIKIWTDHSWELKQKSKKEKQRDQSSSLAIPTPVSPSVKPCKSLSPLNSFFNSLFSTPPSYTSWFVDHDSQIDLETTETAIESILPDNNFQNRNSVLSSQQQLSSISLGSTVFDKFLPIDGKKVKTRKSQNIFDDVNTTSDYSVINMLASGGNQSTALLSSSLSNSSAPVTSKNCQSLTRFLQLSHLSRNNTDLEKENAHFRISEALISAIEHMKWNKLETQKEKSCREATPLATDCLAPQDALQNTTIFTTSSDILEGEHIPYAELEEVSYDLLSAEVVGLSLISKFDEKHLPKVSDLKWLVSDDDTPQKLLPMPDLSSSANPDEHIIHSATRGTRYWAPPRQQIIFTDHPPPNRKELLKKQNYRCAGCGMRVSAHYIQSFRYCTYLGKYHCTGCHRNQISATPAKILQAWDFKCYPVSGFAYRLLEQMCAYPLFYVPDLNPALYIRCKSLFTARNKRLQLKYVKDFIRTCRFALREQSYFDSVPDYITGDIDNWSMSDFIDARTKCLHRSIDQLINKCENHIFNCVLCTARGFLCEYCHADVVIFPWGSRVERCDSCGTCFHRSCWKSMSETCCRCQRIDKRHDEMNGVF